MKSQFKKYRTKLFQSIWNFFTPKTFEDEIKLWITIIGIMALGMANSGW